MQTLNLNKGEYANSIGAIGLSGGDTTEPLCVDQNMGALSFDPPPSHLFRFVQSHSHLSQILRSMMMIQSNTTNETEGTVEVFNFARDSGDEEVDIDMDDGSIGIEAAAAPSASIFKFRSFYGGGGKILTIGGIVLAVAIAFATGFASGNAAKQAELVQMKAEASTSALYTPKSSKVPKAKSSKVPLGWECEMMVDMHFSDSYHGITCDIGAVTPCAGYSPPDACCYGVTMAWSETTDIPLAAMLVTGFTGKSVLAAQGSSGNGIIAGAITFDGIKREYMPATASYNFAWTEIEAEKTYPNYQKTAYGMLDVEIK